MTEIYFGSWQVPKVISYATQLKARNPAINYNANGDMLIDLVARKYSLSLELGRLSDIELSILRTQTEAPFFWVTFFATEVGQLTRQFYMAELPAKIDAEYGGRVWYAPMSLKLEER